MQKYALYGGGALLLVLIGGSLFYASDWRLGENWLPTQTGSIRLKVDPDSTVFLDNRKSDEPDDAGFVTLTKVIPGLRSILVARQGYWPWTKKVYVGGGSTVEVRPFSVPSNPQARVLDKKEKEYQDASRKITSYGLPTNAKPLLSADKTIELFIENENLRARWAGPENETPELFCEGPCGAIDVFRPEKSTIRDVSFFGDRNDVIIIAVTNGVYAVDVNSSGTQNFQPLYLGSEPIFAPLDNHTLYIKDTSYFIRLEY